jgi:hypothetical protein
MKKFQYGLFQSLKPLHKLTIDPIFDPESRPPSKSYIALMENAGPIPGIVDQKAISSGIKSPELFFIQHGFLLR